MMNQSSLSGRLRLYKTLESAKYVSQFLQVLETDRVKWDLIPLVKYPTWLEKEAYCCMRQSKI